MCCSLADHVTMHMYYTLEHVTALINHLKLHVQDKFCYHLIQEH